MTRDHYLELPRSVSIPSLSCPTSLSSRSRSHTVRPLGRPAGLVSVSRQTSKLGFHAIRSTRGVVLIHDAQGLAVHMAMRLPSREVSQIGLVMVEPRAGGLDDVRADATMGPFRALIGVFLRDLTLPTRVQLGGGSDRAGLWVEV